MAGLVLAIHEQGPQAGVLASHTNSRDASIQPLSKRVKKIRAMRRHHMALIDNDDCLQGYRKPRNERIAPMTTMSPIR
jgi:hypothetical protein